VVEDFGEDVPLVLEGGAAQIGLESTILDLTREPPRILRPGGVTAVQIESVLGLSLADDDGQGPAAPGTLEAHYAPRAELILVEESQVQASIQEALALGKCVGVFAPSISPGYPPEVHYFKMGDAAQTAHDLYEALRYLDRVGCDVIFATLVRDEGIGRAVRDRMKRAAVGSRRTSSG
jgi:L-threonylcarbamoyladenylate synthase